MDVLMVVIFVQIQIFFHVLLTIGLAQAGALVHMHMLLIQVLRKLWRALLLPILEIY